MDPEDLSPVQCELLLQVDLLKRHEKMLQHITKEQSAQLQVVTDPKGMFQPHCVGAESVSSSLPSLGVAAACPLPPSPPPQPQEHPLPVWEKFSGELHKSGGFLVHSGLQAAELSLCHRLYKDFLYGSAADGTSAEIMNFKILYFPITFFCLSFTVFSTKFPALTQPRIGCSRSSKGGEPWQISLWISGF